eukprot:6339319-Amphidinium_carterae.1
MSAKKRAPSWTSSAAFLAVWLCYVIEMEGTGRATDVEVAAETAGENNDEGDEEEDEGFEDADAAALSPGEEVDAEDAWQIDLASAPEQLVRVSLGRAQVHLFQSGPVQQSIKRVWDILPKDRRDLEARSKRSSTSTEASHHWAIN